MDLSSGHGILAISRMFSIRQAATSEDFETARVLLREYAAYLNHSLGEEHICLTDYEREVAGLPGVYAAPKGIILLASSGEKPAGCVLLKPLVRSGDAPRQAVEANKSACEMKRLWVRPEFRGQGIGLMLAEKLIAHARQQGYTAMYLDTVPEAMKSANAIYRKLGFVPVERYNTNPILGINPAVAVEFYRLGI